MNLLERAARRFLPLPEVLEPPSARRVRVVSPEPPHEPEPLPDEPFAPVYDFVPLTGEWLGVTPGGWLPARADPVVFGVPYGMRRPEEVAGWPMSYCRCGAGQGEGSGACWNCGRPG